MLRILTVFIIFFAVTYAQVNHPYNSSCTSLNCAKSGASCTGDLYQKNVSFCKNATEGINYKQPTGCCPAGLFCLTGSGNSSSFTCMKDNSGAACSVQSDCWPSLYGTNYMDCVSKVCTTIYGAGDSCSTGTDCFSGTCTSGICTGIGAGQSCASQPARAHFVVCDTNLYCNPGTGNCEATLSSGAACTSVHLGGTPCPAGQFCAGDKCANLGSVASGGNASAVGGISGGLFSDSFLCSSGLAANISSGQCVTGKAIALTSCTNDTDCSSMENSKCECHPNGKGYCSLMFNTSMSPDDTGVSEGVSLMNCLAKYNCSYNYLSTNGLSYANNDPNSCAVKNCNSYLKKYAAAPCSFMKPMGSCTYMPYCSGFPVWAIIVIVVVAILLVLAVVFVIFLVLRKRRDYSSI